MKDYTDFIAKLIHNYFLLASLLSSDRQIIYLQIISIYRHLSSKVVASILKAVHLPADIQSSQQRKDTSHRGEAGEEDQMFAAVRTQVSFTTHNIGSYQIIRTKMEEL